MIMFPGGFSAGDEPDGSAKFFATAFQNAKIKEAVEKLLKDANGINPCHVGRLPVQLAAMNMTNINVQLLTIEAAATRSKEKIYQAAMLEPHTAAELNIDDIKAMFDLTEKDCFSTAPDSNQNFDQILIDKRNDIWTEML